MLVVSAPYPSMKHVRFLGHERVAEQQTHDIFSDTSFVSPTQTEQKRASSRAVLSSISLPRVPFGGSNIDNISGHNNGRVPRRLSVASSKIQCPGTPINGTHHARNITTTEQERNLTMSLGRSTPKQRVGGRDMPGGTLLPLSPMLSPAPPSSSFQVGHDNKFAYSKVFQTRYKAAATRIQSIARSLAARRRFHMLREVAIELNQRTKAATQIQAVVRRLAIAPILKVLQLEFQLRTIEKARISELRAIDEWKAKKMRVVREKYEAKVSIITEQERKTAETVDAAILHISHLRKVNARLRAKNETLRSAIDQLLVENKMLNAEASKYSNFRELTASMSKADKDNSLKRFMLDEFESRKVALEVAIESRDERIMLENKIGRLYFNATKSIVLHMENTCHDDSLVYTIEDMCLELENRCSGLDETECDGSEEDFPSP